MARLAGRQIGFRLFYFNVIVAWINFSQQVACFNPLVVYYSHMGDETAHTWADQHHIRFYKRIIRIFKITVYKP